MPVIRLWGLTLAAEVLALLSFYLLAMSLGIDISLVSIWLGALRDRDGDDAAAVHFRARRSRRHADLSAELLTESLPPRRWHSRSCYWRDVCSLGCSAEYCDQGLVIRSHTRIDGRPLMMG